LDEKPAFLSRYAFQMKEALKANTHFGMEGGIPFQQEHEVLEHPEFRTDTFLKNLHGKAVRQLGSSGGGNHFVEWGELELFETNVFNLPAGKYTALLSHSGSRGLGTEIARHYSAIAREQCRLPREAGHFAWLDMDSEAGQAYWMSMNLAGDYAKACHERIHINLTKALGLKILATIGNNHNFAWKETLSDGREAIVHRKGATPAHAGEPGIIPGSMTTPGYLVAGKGNVQSLHSASHGAGRAMSRQKAKENFTQSALKKMLSVAGVQLIGGSVEEAPLAYKDIERVMDFQQELVDIHGKFMPRIVRMNEK
jgi:tRNA-splicing ligase RtcB